jgi:energy-coupling factor transporter ATP-binding protein EcfA2
MIDTSNLAKEYGARVLFEDVTLQLNAGSRYGLVGANGSGKTTFLRLLAGDEEPSHGTFNLAKRARLGVLRQDRFLDDDEIIIDLAMRGDAVVWDALAEQRASPRKAIPTRAGSAIWKTSSPRTTATPWRRAPARCWSVWAFPWPFIARRCPRCRAGSSCACCWRRCWSAARTFCCSTSRPTTSTS